MWLDAKRVPARRADRLSLLQYHFDSRQGFLIAVLEDEQRVSQELQLERKRAMAGAIDPLGQRKNALDAFLETKVAAGFRIETHTDTHAIIIVGGHRKPLWSRFRKHGAGSRYVVSVDERGEVTMTPAEPRRN